MSSLLRNPTEFDLRGAFEYFLSHALLEATRLRSPWIAYMKALVLGGTGFVGMNVARALVAEGHDVAATRRHRANTLFARKLGVELVRTELDDPDSLVEAMKGREVVFHCAGYYPRYSLNPEEQVQLARQATTNVTKAARKASVDRLVLTSSVATVGAPRHGRLLSNESDRMSKASERSVYFAVKQAIEQVVLEERCVETMVLCASGIIGELDVKAGTGFVIVALAHGMLPFYIEGKTNIVDADDMAVAHVRAGALGRAGERYILGGHNLTIREMLLAICEELNIRFVSWRLPASIAAPMATLDEMRCSAQGQGARPFIPREFVDIVRYGQWFDTSKSHQALGLEEPTPLDVTIRKACAWYERFRYIPNRGCGRSSSKKRATPQICAAAKATKPRKSL